MWRLRSENKGVVWGSAMAIAVGVLKSADGSE